MVRLTRQATDGPGEIVVEGVDDDSGRARRVRVDLDQGQYAEAVRAHSDGLVVRVLGDLLMAGTTRRISSLREFAVLPGDHRLAG